MADNIDVLDGDGDSRTLATSETATVHTPKHIVTKVTPGTDGTDLGKAEDNAHASGHVGVMALGVRTDTTAARSGTDGDYEPLQIKGGRAATSAVVETVTPPASIFNGQKTVAATGTAEAIAATQAANGVTIKALAANTNPVYVGNSGVTTSNGYELAAGEAVFLEVDDLAKVFVDVTTNGEGVSFLAT